MNMGVFTTAHLWNKYFGSSCDTFGPTTFAPLWYATYGSNGQVNSAQSYTDFVDFGGYNLAWAQSNGVLILKQVGGNYTIQPFCGHSNWFSSVDEIWGS